MYRRRVPAPVELIPLSSRALGSGVLTPAAAEDLATTLKALADPVRLRLLSILLASPAGEACTCDLVDPLGIAQPTVTHHLGRLAAAGVVTSERRGRWTWYRVDPSALEALRDVLTVVPADARESRCP